MSSRHTSDDFGIPFLAGLVLIALVIAAYFILKQCGIILRAFRIDPTNKCLWIALGLLGLAACYAVITSVSPLSLVLLAVCCGAIFFISRVIQDGV